jgi:hypothetical protein
VLHHAVSVFGTRPLLSQRQAYWATTSSNNHQLNFSPSWASDSSTLQAALIHMLLLQLPGMIHHFNYHRVTVWHFKA